ncbi:Ribbon-helix-helix protein%2C copG family [Shigella sonnei]|nr:Ribbon-helix-helix protein%2C copG family [Shigella sonnei]
MKNNTAQATKVITAHVPLPMADKVDQMAARLERSRGWVIKQALSAWLALIPCVASPQGKSLSLKPL